MKFFLYHIYCVLFISFLSYNNVFAKNNVKNSNTGLMKSNNYTSSEKKNKTNNNENVKDDKNNTNISTINKDNKSKSDELDLDNLIVPEDQVPLKLENLIYIALKRNDSTKTAFINLKKAEYQLKKQESVYYPNISASGHLSSRLNDKNDEYLRELGANLDVGYTIFAFGKNKAMVDSAKHYLSSLQYSKDQNAQDIIYKLIYSYYNLLSLEAKKNAALENESLSKETYKVATLKYKLGIVPLVDKLKSKNKYSQDKLARINIENEIKKQKSNLNNILNLEPDYVLYIENPEINIKKINNNLNYYLLEAKLNRYDLKILTEQKNLEEKKLKSIKLQRYPNIVANGSIKENKNLKIKNSDFIKDTNLSIVVSVPIFTGFDISSSINIQEKEIENIEIKIKKKEIDISNEVWDSYHDLDNSQISYFIAKESLETAQENANVTLGMYKNGKASILEVIQSQSDLESAKTAFINSKYNWLISRINLLKAVGKIDLDSIINLDNI